MNSLPDQKPVAELSDDELRAELDAMARELVRIDIAEFMVTGKLPNHEERPSCVGTRYHDLICENLRRDVMSGTVAENDGAGRVPMFPPEFLKKFREANSTD